MSDGKPENRKRWFWKNWPWWVKVIAVIWMLLPLFLLFLAPKWISPPQENGSPQNLFNHVRTIMLILAAWYGVPFLIWRTILADRQTQATDKQTEINRESHYTELFTKAVEQLGAVREIPGKEPEPALEIRIGAIFSLERLAKDSERDYGPIIETLAAYIREHCRDPKSFDDKKLSGDELKQARQEWIEFLCENPPANRSDVAAVLTVLSRREKSRNWTSASENETQPDFTGANFQGATLWNKNEGLARAGTNLRLIYLDGADIRGADLSDVHLSDVHLSGAILIAANLPNAILIGAKLSGADLQKANLSNAELMRAKLSGANLWKANLSDATLEGANLSDAILEEANLSDTILEGANLWGANLSKARLDNAKLSGAKFEGTLLVGTHLKDTTGLTDEMLEKAFGDGDISLPDGLTRPEHWGSQEEAIKKWRAFLGYDW